MNRVWNRIGMIVKEEKFLNIQVVAFAALPVLYFIYLEMTSVMAGIGVKEIFAQNPYESLNLLVNFSAIYSAYVVYIYRRDKYIKENFLAYILIAIAQICMGNTVGIMLMLYSVCYFIGLSNIPKYFREYQWGKNYKALFSAVLVTVVALVILAIRIRLALAG